MTTLSNKDPEEVRLTLALLNTVERSSEQSHRRLSLELGIALGLTNAYVRRCVKKGFLKVKKSKPQYYAYYLTPRGFAEKSRLTAEYLSFSFHFFRQARAACMEAFADVPARAGKRIIFAGVSDLAEIAGICARESGIEIVGIVQPGAICSTFSGYPVVASYDSIAIPFDAVFVTDLKDPRATLENAIKKFSPDRVIIPSILARYIPEGLAASKLGSTFGNGHSTRAARRREGRRT